MASLGFLPTNFQEQSPLFGVLPGEIRNEIFAYALMQYEDDASAYPEDSYWYRPGFAAPRKANSALLQTCKAAYAEGQKVFLRDLEWAFWFDRGPDGRSGNSACIRFFRNLTPSAVQALQRVRFFTQLYWLESGSNLRLLFSMPNFRPTELTITIRYSDWWFWENNTPLKMDEAWLRGFVGTPGLRQLRVEYETLHWKKAEMMQIIERNKKWKLLVRCEGEDATIEEGYLSAEKTELQEWKWTGTAKLGGQVWNHHGKGEDGETVEYVVVTDTWKFVEGELSEEEMKERRIVGPYMGEGYLGYDDMTDEYVSEQDMTDEDMSEYDEDRSEEEVSEYDEDSESID
ncbi:hypothetical protein EK21DRAFT_116049 [Setomelanomma holmii]|uniref:Uncharacterized protein n=1 Tax=Setomelanomma holmii TaxID=210430 RepID=A0A9P4H2P3_9PLEO|nr:hypothetical protein EK21DRAFT_116049 [Setomelanomma holmii]